ncbi:MAG: thiamine diphosphokinase [Spirochaetaceae bacterium]|jgi:thiamine pyrophosphokinase|nr:thiamine diphosphokinase [Spirochaetaceae bacterium]
MSIPRYGAAFIGSLAPPPALCRTLCAGADLVVAADSGLVTAEEAGVKPDWVVGDMDSLADLSRLDRYPPERVRRFPRDKDLLDTEIALNLLWDEGCTDIVLIGGGGGRLDHLLALRALFDRPRCPRRWVTNTEDVQAVDEGGTLALCVPLNTLVSVLPAACGPWKASSDGLKWPLDRVRIDSGWVGISNIASAKQVVFRAERGRFLVLHPHLPPPAVEALGRVVRRTGIGPPTGAEHAQE